MTSLLDFYLAQTPRLLTKLLEQIYLVSLSTLLAILIAIPLGILIYHHGQLKKWILGFAGILQTIPSLALLAFLLPIFGIGIKPAIIALTLYALLPIIRNTVTGLSSVPAANVDAAKGLGFTKPQQLWLVELPLAMPAIIAGIRTATVINVGVTTLAAFIGAGGLGDFINEGLATSNNRLIILGAIHAAILALLLDYFIGKIEKIISSRNNKTKRNFKLSIIIIVIVAIITGSSIWFHSRENDNKNSIRIATKNFTEQIILGEMMAQVIEHNTNLKVTRKFNLGTTEICHQAMLQGAIDIYPEYTGTAYLLILKNTYHPGTTVDQVFNLVKQEYKKKFNLIWLPAFGFNNTQALAVTKNFAKQNTVATISSLLPLSHHLTLGTPPEFFTRPDGYRGLHRVYHLNFGKVINMDPGLMYSAIQNDQVNIIVAFSTDGRIPAYGLQLLIDDKQLFPPYYAAPIIRKEFLNEHPEVAIALKPLANRIDDKTMRKLNTEVDLEKLPITKVVKQFLTSKGLL